MNNHYKRMQLPAGFFSFFEGNEWGTHVCHFYENKEDLLEVLVPFFLQGLRENEACIWVVAEPLRKDDAKAALMREVPDLERYEKTGQMSFIGHTDWYIMPDGGLKPREEVVKAWLERKQEALKEFRGLRVTGNVHFIKDRGDWAHFVDYEHFVNNNLAPHEIKAVCSYPVEAVKEPVEMVDAVLNHQAALIRRGGEWVFSENPQYRTAKELRRQEEKLQELTGKLKSSNAELARFAYVVSHDLKEPLRTISCYTELLQMRYEGALDAEAGNFLGRIYSSAIRAQELINGLLEFSRLDQTERKFTGVDCNRILEATLEDLRFSIEESGVDINAGLLPEVEGDELLIRQLFQNLISNAIKFRNGDIPRIRLSSRLDEDRWIFCFQDNGIGIKPEFIPRLFTVFQRLHSRHEYPGTGIGLAICKKIVEKHGGRIWVESEAGKGASFFFSIPEKKKKIVASTEAVPDLCWQDPLKNPAPGGHFVHIYENVSSLKTAVSFFIQEGLAKGECALIVARENHAKMFLEALAERQIHTAGLQKEGRLAVLDAEETLASFMNNTKNGEPDRFAFEAAVARVIRAMLDRGPAVRIYGEMVDILAARQNFEAAIKLERYWNRLAETVPFTLFCAYHKNHVRGKYTDSSFVLQVCENHTRTLSRALEIPATHSGTQS